MKNKIILIIVLVVAALAYTFKDKLIPVKKSAVVVEETSTPISTTSQSKTRKPVDSSFKLLNYANVITNQSIGQYDPRPDLVNAIVPFNKLFLKDGISFEVFYKYFNFYEGVPEEKWKSDVVVARTLAVVDLIEKGAEIEPLFFVSPSKIACYQEVQVVTLLDSPINSVADLQNKSIISEGLRGVHFLPIRMYVTDHPILPKESNAGDTIEVMLDKLWKKEADAGIFISGLFVPTNPITKNFKILATSDYKIPCYTLYIKKSLAPEIKEKFKAEMLAISQDLSKLKVMNEAVGSEYIEAITPEAFAKIKELTKKYDKATVKLYVPPPPPEKKAEDAAKPAATAEPAPAPATQP